MLHPYFLYEYSPAFDSECLFPGGTNAGPLHVVKLCCLAARWLLQQQRKQPVMSHAQNLPARHSISTEQSQLHRDSFAHPIPKKYSSTYNSFVFFL